MRKIIRTYSLLLSALVTVAGCGKVVSSSQRSGSTIEDPKGDDQPNDVVPPDVVHKPKPVVKGPTDKVKPTIAFAGLLDKTVRRAESIPVSITADGTGSKIARVAWAYAANGENFGADVAVEGAKTKFDAVIPPDTSSSTNARIKVTVTDEGGNQASVTSGPMMVISQAFNFDTTYDPTYMHTDGPADKARIQLANGLTSDGTYIYIITSQGVRRTRLSDGFTDTISGSPFRFTGTKDGTGRDASWSLGRAGTYLNKKLYVTDYADHIIRTVDVDDTSPTFGLTETIAGVKGVSGAADTAPGVDAKFSTPFGITNDGTYIYVADYGSHTIRRLNPADNSVTTVAGLAGSAASVNGPMGANRLANPRTLVYDQTKKLLYFIEPGFFRIRTLDPATGIVANFAGTSNKFGAVDGPGVNARFPYPVDLTSDGTYLYVSDIYDHTVRKIGLNDTVVSSVAGGRGIPGFANGVGAAARFSYPHSLVYVNGAVYVGDARNAMLRKVVPSTGAVTTFAGAPLGSTPKLSPLYATLNGAAATLSSSRGIVTDNGDDFYMTGFAHTIRHVKISANSVTTIAGANHAPGSADGIGAAARFDLPRCITKVGNTLYICDQYAQTIRTLDLTSNEVTTIAGAYNVIGAVDDTIGTNARFSGLQSLVSDGTYLYIADSNNRRIRRMELAPPHAVTTIAGGTSGYLDHATGTSARFGEMWGMALNGTDLYVCDYSNHAIRKIDLAGGNAVTTIAGAPPPTATSGFVDSTDPALSRLFRPMTVSIDGGKLIIYDESNSRIRSYDLTTNEVRTVAGPGTATPVYIDAVGKNARGRFLTGTTFGGKFYGLTDAHTLTSIDLTTAETQLIGPSTIASRIYGAANSGAADGLLLDTTGSSSLQCIVSDGLHLYATTTIGEVIKMKMDGSNAQSIAGGPRNGFADGVGAAARFGRLNGCVIRDGWMYATDSYNSVIRRINLSSKLVETIAGQPGTSGSVDGVGAAARFNTPHRLLVLGDDLIIADAADNTVRKMSLAPGDFGTVSTLAGQSGVKGSDDGIGAAATFYNPGGMVALNDRIFITDYGGTVREIDPVTKAVTTFAGVADERGIAAGIETARFDLPAHLATDGQDLFVADAGAALIRKIRMQNKLVTTFAGRAYNASGLVDPKAGDAALSVRSAWIFVPGSGFYGTGSGGLPERLH